MFLKVFDITAGFSSVSYCSKSVAIFEFCSLMLLLLFFVLKNFHTSRGEKFCKAYGFVCILLKDTNFLIYHPEWACAAPVLSCTIHAEVQTEAFL